LQCGKNRKDSAQYARPCAPSTVHEGEQNHQADLNDQHNDGYSNYHSCIGASINGDAAAITVIVLKLSQMLIPVGGERDNYLKSGA